MSHITRTKLFNSWTLVFIVLLYLILFYLVISSIPNRSTLSTINTISESQMASLTEKYMSPLNATQNVIALEDNSYHNNVHWNHQILKIFLHFHKAGGTSIVDAARLKARFFNPNFNANPNYNDGSSPFKFIPFWTYNATELEKFIKLCLNEQNASFIAMENHYFHDSGIISNAFKRKNKIELVTQLRDPFRRLLSNYYHDRGTGWHSETKYWKDRSVVDRLKRYHNVRHEVVHKYNAPGKALWNMYIRVLTNNFDINKNVTQNDLEIAKQELNKFDLITVLEQPEMLKLWNLRYGMTIKHSNHRNWETTDMIYVEQLKQFEKEFKILNKYDYQLVEYATHLSHNMLYA